tara:strand:- start:1080 stop:1274 length:195 start_codon:yes stop_codon:yes gene_type:complete
MVNETERMWIDKHYKRKEEILKQLEKYFRVRGKAKVELVNDRFTHEITKLQNELHDINKLMDLI